MDEKASSAEGGVAVVPQPVAIVTAAGRGIGQAIARYLAEKEYRLVLMSSGEGAQRLAVELGAVSYTGSVTDPEDLRATVELALDTFGRIDGVVNNTGHPAKGPLLELTRAQWQQGLELLLLNVTTMAGLVTPHMVGGGGSIVNISTFSALEPSLDFPISSTIRAGLAAYIKLFARQYMKEGVRMNNVLPGFMNSYPETEEIISRIPAGRFGKVEELARVVSFLLSDEASYLTGQNIAVDGGLARSI